MPSPTAERLRQISLSLAAALLVSCGGSDSTEPDLTVASVTISATATTVAPGNTLQLSAAAKNAGGNTLTGMTATWSSSTEAVATVNSSGLVSAVANGTTTITATIAGKVGTKLITVQPPTATASVDANAANSFNPEQVDITAGGQVTWSFTGLQPHNVTFSAGAGAPSNIPSTATGNVSRTFAAAGTYNYQCTNHPGMSGTVVVH
jgi:plastocyanin